jgi:hypothetical protein
MDSLEQNTLSAEANRGSGQVQSSEPESVSKRLAIREANRLPKQISDILLRLERLTLRLRLFGLFGFLCTGTNLLLLFVTLLGPRFYGSSTKLITTVMLEVTVVALLIVTSHEYLRKSGDSLFEEISDDLQKNVRSKDLRLQKTKARASKNKVPNSARYTLRAFAKGADLPLIPGRFGPAIYAGINLVLLFLHYFIITSQGNDLSR